ncbi:hypothetical protein ACFY12_10085 [Streptomyces sp. NPDC001339]|uniref:hypothetical protein n=1 Tax=Streptomyces sp. NPDC001339 TaxID=3364563 RepID=UPI0036C59324
MQEHRVKNMGRVNFVIAGACGLLLAIGGASPAAAGDGPFDEYGADGVYNSDTYADFRAVLHCGPRAKVCVNGPVNSGNLKYAQNIWLAGNPTDSGSPKNDNGNTNVDSGGTTGAENKTSNDIQHFGPGSTHL